jgi:hypothetical protein
MLRDPTVRLLGFQEGPRGLESGFFLFSHSSCGTSLALEISDLADLSQEPTLSPSACSSGVNREICLASEELGECPAECICRFVRNVKQIIEAWRKH